MYNREIEEILQVLGQNIDVPRVRESMQRPWRRNREQWFEFVQRSFPQQSFDLSETINGQTKSYTFRMTDGIRERMLEQLLDLEDQIRPEMAKAIEKQGISLVQRMRDFVQRQSSITWGEILKGHPKGFWSKLIVPSQIWHDKPVRCDSLYRVLWGIVKS